MERQLERLRMCCVVAVVVVVVVFVVVAGVAAGVGDGCHSGSGELKWQKDRRAGSSLGCKDCLPHPPCPRRASPYHFCNKGNYKEYRDNLHDREHERWLRREAMTADRDLSMIKGRSEARGRGQNDKEQEEAATVVPRIPPRSSLPAPGPAALR